MLCSRRVYSSLDKMGTFLNIQDQSLFTFLFRAAKYLDGNVNIIEIVRLF